MPPVRHRTVRSAAIESNGTVLALVLNGVSVGSWSDYGFASGMADTTMAGVTLATTARGSTAAADRPRPTRRARAVYGLKPLHKTPILPSSAATPNATLLDEVDNGNGTRTVRLRLSRYVYAGDACTLNLSTGWHTGAAAQNGLAVTTTRPRLPNPRSAGAGCPRPSSA
jgi:hypothetical protein